MMPNELMHYGVLGMKWGIRRNRAKAYAKSSKKLQKINTKYQSRQEAANKAYAKAERKTYGIFSNERKAERAFGAASKSQYKANKLANKGKKWYEAMNRNFDRSIDTFSERDIAAGENFIKVINESSRNFYTAAQLRRK